MRRFKGYILILMTMTVIGLAIAKVSEYVLWIPDLNFLEAVAVYHIGNYTVSFINNLLTGGNIES